MDGWMDGNGRRMMDGDSSQLNQQPTPLLRCAVVMVVVRGWCAEYRSIYVPYYHTPCIYVNVECVRGPIVFYSSLASASSSSEDVMNTR